MKGIFPKFLKCYQLLPKNCKLNTHFQSKSEEKENKARNVPLQSLHAPNVNQESQRT